MTTFTCESAEELITLEAGRGTSRTRKAMPLHSMRIEESAMFSYEQSGGRSGVFEGIARPRDAAQRKSVRQYSTSSHDSPSLSALGVRERANKVSRDRRADTIVICGGTKPGGNQPRMTGRRSTGSRAIRAWRMAPTRAPEGSRSPHSSIVQLPSTMLMTA
jgi:hypothetical protein